MTNTCTYAPYDFTPCGRTTAPGTDRCDLHSPSPQSLEEQIRQHILSLDLGYKYQMSDATNRAQELDYERKGLAKVDTVTAAILSAVKASLPEKEQLRRVQVRKLVNDVFQYGTLFDEQFDELDQKTINNINASLDLTTDKILATTVGLEDVK